MRRVIFAINTTADGYCSHTDMIADDELHMYFTRALRNASVILFDRITYQLMVPYWPEVAKTQSETEATNEFARVFDSLDKVVFSNEYGWICEYNTVGSPPPQRRATITLIRHRRADLLRRILEGPNLEARVYATDGVFYLDYQARSDRLTAQTTTLAHLTCAHELSARSHGRRYCHTEEGDQSSLSISALASRSSGTIRL